MPSLKGRFGPPLVGETLALYRDPYAFGAHHFARYGPVFKSHLLGKPTAVFLSAEGQRYVLVTAQHSLDTGAGYRIIQDLLGGALTLTDGEIHEQIKHWMVPAFATRNMAMYLETINRVIAGRLADWGDSGTRQLLPEFSTITFSLGTALLLGFDFGPETQEFLHHWNTFAKGVTTLIHFVPGPVTKFGRAKAARQWLDAHILAIVLRQRETAQPNIIRMLSEAGMPDNEIVTQIRFLIHASFDTTTDTLAWAFTEMLRHPDLLERVRAEVRADDRDAPITLEDLQHKPLLDAVIKETLRLYPQVHLFFRGAKEDLEFDGFAIPKGWLVGLIPAFTHRRPDYFAAPDTFDPDRFLGSRDEDKAHPYAWVGFGAGMHGCLGEMIARLEIKALATAILRSFDLTLASHQDLRQVYAALSRPRSGVQVTYRRRN
jgi:retinoid hydroxylase